MIGSSLSTKLIRAKNTTEDGITSSVKSNFTFYNFYVVEFDMHSQRAGGFSDIEYQDQLHGKAHQVFTALSCIYTS